ncbi:Hypothetical Protein FCC1311_004192 [Hondaea fermentalgiana]|uniref:Uncharacterized protein n=1 Tax=Hondaea fermentalgiana TaxID=2315210 RepID=A0A2R5G836_9STRA|nr:Hypothetical Protein FCC1311_004192 [Hondaea fermentalgiana]|eukprot:GBG24201.1 Hypothetical Protein FCC1311_004192 [Hondaea fermentalgiana]
MMHFHGERQVLRRLRAVSSALVVLMVVGLLIPWARVTAPATPGLYADVGLTWCHGGPMCKALESAYGHSSSSSASGGDSKGGAAMPPWASKFVTDQVESSELYAASVVALSGMGLTLACILGAEFVWSRFGYQTVRGLDYRVVLQLASCGIFLSSTIVYIVMAQNSLNEGRFLVGVWLSLVGGVLALLSCILILVRMNDMEDPLDVLEPKGVRYGAFA